MDLRYINHKEPPQEKCKLKNGKEPLQDMKSGQKDQYERIINIHLSFMKNLKLKSNKISVYIVKKLY